MPSEQLPEIGASKPAKVAAPHQPLIKRMVAPVRTLVTATDADPREVRRAAVKVGGGAAALGGGIYGTIAGIDALGAAEPGVVHAVGAALTSMPGVCALAGGGAGLVAAAVTYGAVMMSEDLNMNDPSWTVTRTRAHGRVANGRNILGIATAGVGGAAVLNGVAEAALHAHTGGLETVLVGATVVAASGAAGMTAARRATRIGTETPARDRSRGL